MNISATARSTTLFFQRQSPAWWTTTGVLAAVAVTAGFMLWTKPGVPADHASHSSGARPLFAGWVKPGGDFGQAPSTTASTQPKWVLATEPSEQEVEALESALADHPDKTDELNRLIEYSRFQKQVALWSELQSGPLDAERSTLGAHLLASLPAHYNRGELMGPQALLMAKALIKDIEPNPQRQDARLAEAKTRLAHEAPALPEGEAVAQTAFDTFKQQQQQIVSEHSGSPQQLEAKLDAARRTLLDTAPPGAGPNAASHP